MKNALWYSIVRTGEELRGNKGDTDKLVARASEISGNCSDSQNELFENLAHNIYKCEIIQRAFGNDYNIVRAYVISKLCYYGWSTALDISLMPLFKELESKILEHDSLGHSKCSEVY